MNEPEFQEIVAEGLGQRVYERLPKNLSYLKEAVQNSK